LVSGNNESIIDARGIVNRFGRQTVHEGLALQVKAGEVLGIAGGSGSGKSVLLKTLVGLHRPAQGDVRLDGRPVGELQPAEKASLLGVLFQQGALFSSLTVAQNVMLPLRLHHRLRQVDQERIAALKLALTGLPADAGAKLPAQLSGGMVKRAAVQAHVDAHAARVRQVDSHGLHGAHVDAVELDRIARRHAAD
jgi:phospholipid/cholesterol/gamma-HCH transport system ATP-binding protein